jgi:hypothetical protein
VTREWDERYARAAAAIAAREAAPKPKKKAAPKLKPMPHVKPRAKAKPKAAPRPKLKPAPLPRPVTAAQPKAPKVPRRAQVRKPRYAPAPVTANVDDVVVGLVWVILAGQNRWHVLDALAQAPVRIGPGPKVRVSRAQVLAAAGSPAGLRSFDQSEGKLRVHTLEPERPHGLSRRCDTCGSTFHIDGPWLAQMVKEREMQKVCWACLPKPLRVSRESTDLAVRRAAPEPAAAPTAQPRVHASGLPLTQDVVPGEGPGTPGGCIHGLQRAICRTCSQKHRR